MKLLIYQNSRLDFVHNTFINSHSQVSGPEPKGPLVITKAKSYLNLLCKQFGPKYRNVCYVFLGVTGRFFFLNYDVFLSLKIVQILTNNADSDEMQHSAAFHLVFTVCRVLV